jgi:hypothetical protein
MATDSLVIISKGIKAKIWKMHSVNEIAIQGEAEGTACAFVNRLWASLSFKDDKYFEIISTGNSLVSLQLH